MGGRCEFHVLPPWPELHRRAVGRAPRGALCLRDMKARNRHMRLLPVGLDRSGHADGCLSATCLVARPIKGKPIRLLLGGAGHMLRAPWRLRAGDIFCVGLSQVRIADGLP